MANTLKYHMDLQKAVERAKIKFGLSDQALGNKIGLSKVAIYKWRIGQTENPNSSNIREFADLFNYEAEIVNGRWDFTPSDLKNKYQTIDRLIDEDNEAATAVLEFMHEQGISGVEEIRKVFRERNRLKKELKNIKKRISEILD